MPEKRDISCNEIASDIHIIYMNFNLLVIVKTKYWNRKTRNFFFILPIYPICEKKVFISLILRRFVEKRAQPLN